MAQFDIYVDTYSGESVAGPTNAALSPLPKFIQGDTPTYRIYLLARTTTYPISNPYSIINNAALSLKVALGPKTGTAGSTLYTQQFTWSRDATNSYFTATFPLNTAAIATLLGSGESATAWFEIEYTQDAVPTTVLQKNVTIDAEVIETGSLTTPPGSTAMSAEEANAVFLKREITGQIILINATDSTKKVILYCDENGSFRADTV